MLRPMILAVLLTMAASSCARDSIDSTGCAFAVLEAARAVAMACLDNFDDVCPHPLLEDGGDLE